MWREMRLSAAVAELGRHIIGREASLAVKRAGIDPEVWRTTFAYINDRTSTQAESKPGFAQWRRQSFMTNQHLFGAGGVELWYRLNCLPVVLSS
jgi:hypothetical protein